MAKLGKNAEKIDYSKGLLDLEGVRTVYVEPGVLAKVTTKNCPVYEKKPVRVEQKNRRGLFSRKPQFNTDANEVIHTLKEGEEVIIRKIPTLEDGVPGYHSNNPDIYHATIFKRASEKQDDMPETGDEIEVLKEGYIIGKPFKHIESFEPFDGVLFDKLPSPRDVNQSTFGDCYFLSAINSILSKDEGINFFRKMMKQLEHTTVVRLYNPITLEPMYVEVENSIYHKNGHSPVRHKANWVSILEKAFAGAGFAMENDNPAKTNGSLLNMYGSGGNPSLALTMLTGQKNEDYYFYDKRIQFDDDNQNMFQMLPWKGVHMLINVYRSYLLEDHDMEWLEEKVVERLKNLETMDVDNYLKAFGKFENLVKWIDYNYRLMMADPKFAKEESEKLETIQESISKMREGKNEISLTDALMAVNEFSQLKNMPEEVIEAWKQYIALPKTVQIQTLDGEEKEEKCWRFRNEKQLGVYTEKDLEVYRKLEELIDNHYLVASTHQKYSQKVPGLRNKHAYAVERIETKDEQGVTMKYVILYNPWGNTGMVNDGDNFSENRALGHFKVELSLFVKYFRKISFTKRAQSAGLTEYSKREIGKELGKENNYYAQRLFGTKTAGVNKLDRTDCVSRIRILKRTAEQLVLDTQNDRILSSRFKGIARILGMINNGMSGDYYYHSQLDNYTWFLIDTRSITYRFRLENLDESLQKRVKSFYEEFNQLRRDIVVKREEKMKQSREL